MFQKCQQTPFLCIIINIFKIYIHVHAYHLTRKLEPSQTIPWTCIYRPLFHALIGHLLLLMQQGTL